MQFKKSHIIFILSMIIIILLFGGFGSLLYSKIYGKEKAITVIKDFYKLSIGLDIEVLRVQEQNGLYSVTIRSGGTTQEVFLTKDLKAITDNLKDINTAKESMIIEEAFSSCLRYKGVKLFIGDDPKSQQQLSNLGRFSHLLSVNCDTDNELCEHLGINTVPSVLFKDTIYPGVKTTKWFENVMGCKFD